MVIGWIGTGNMGARMAERLVLAGYKLFVFNRTRSKAQRVLDAGDAEFLTSPAEIARQCDLIFTSVTNDDAMREILNGENGLLCKVKSGQIFVEMSTLSPDCSDELRETMHKLGVLYLDAPVVGSMFMIEQGLLKILASGDKDAYDIVLPYFKAIGRSSVYLGSGAQARYMKIAVNMMICSYLTIYGEVLLAGEGMGFSWEELNTLLENSDGASPMLNDKGTTHKARVWGGTTALTSTAMKDLSLALDCAGKAHFALPLTAMICQYDCYMHFNPKYELYSTFGTIGVLEDWCGKGPGDYASVPGEKKAELSNTLAIALVGATILLAYEAVLFCRKADVEWNAAIDCLGTCHGASKYFKKTYACLTGGQVTDTISIEDVRNALNLVLKNAKENGLFLPILATTCQELNRIASNFEPITGISAIML